MVAINLEANIAVTFCLCPGEIIIIDHCQRSKIFLCNKLLYLHYPSSFARYSLPSREFLSFFLGFSPQILSGIDLLFSRNFEMRKVEKEVSCITDPPSRIHHHHFRFIFDLHRIESFKIKDFDFPGYEEYDFQA